MGRCDLARAFKITRDAVHRVNDQDIAVPEVAWPNALQVILKSWVAGRRSSMAKKMKAGDVSFSALTKEGYERLLDAVYIDVKAPQDCTVENQSQEYWIKGVRGLFQLIRSRKRNFQLRGFL